MTQNSVESILPKMIGDYLLRTNSRYLTTFNETIDDHSFKTAQQVRNALAGIGTMYRRPVSGLNQESMARFIFMAARNENVKIEDFIRLVGGICSPAIKHSPKE